jgi:translation initiation factor 4G
VRPPRREDRETEELFRKFQGILNRLSPQRFQNQAEQALQLKIDDEERLKGCIDKIFTKVRGVRERERERE